MAGNTFGQLFKVTTWGESHGPAVGAVIDGCPPKIGLCEKDIQAMLDRRRPGTVATSTSRKEPDKVEILSGVFENKTMGTPICVMVKNKDARPEAYYKLKDLYRPGHGDITYNKKYGVRDYRGGGRASARETVGRVAAGAVAGLVISRAGIKTISYTLELGGVRAKKIDLDAITKNPFACPDPEAAKQMAVRVDEVKKKGDSIGGIVEIVATNVMPGLGEPVFDKIDAAIASAMMSIGAVKGVEIGAGFGAANLLGSQNNDPILPSGFGANNAGGTLAGISSGQPIVVRVAIKPIPSVRIAQQTIDINGKPQTIEITGRHDISAIPRINVVCEAMMNLVLADLLLRQAAISA